MKPFITLSIGLSRNAKLFMGKFVDMSKKLKGISSCIPMVPPSDLEVVKGEVSLLKDEKVIFESKVAKNHRLEQEIAPLKGKVASLELEKIGHVENITILVSGKLRVILGTFVLKNTDLQAIVTDLTRHVLK